MKIDNQKLPWCSIVGGSLTGQRHVRSNEDNQDRFKISITDNHSIMIVSDGLGSLSKSGEGAELLCNSVCCELEKYLQSQIHQESKNLDIETLKESVCAGVEATRNICSEKGSLKDYGATLLGAVANENYVVWFHIGDGFLGIYDTEGNMKAYSDPENGESDNIVYPFTGNDWLNNLRMGEFTQKYQSIWLMSDGGHDLLKINTEERLRLSSIEKLEDFIFQQNRGAEVLIGVMNTEDAKHKTSDDMTLISLHVSS